MSEKELKKLQKIFDAIDLQLLDDGMISEENLKKSAKKITMKQAKKLDKLMLGVCLNVALSAYKMLVVMAKVPQIKMTNIIFEREGDKVTMKFSVGAIEYLIDGKKKVVINPAFIKSIESEGGENGEKEES